MHLWVDADACPNGVKDILYRAAERLQLPLTLVANQFLRTPPLRFIRAIQVPAGFDVADNRIAAEQLHPIAIEAPDEIVQDGLKVRGMSGHE